MNENTKDSCGDERKLKNQIFSFKKHKYQSTKKKGTLIISELESHLGMLEN